jgi:hypothetical protein
VRLRFINLEAALDEMHRIHTEFEASKKDDQFEKELYDEVMNLSYIILTAFGDISNAETDEKEKDRIDREGMKSCLNLVNLYLEEYGD